MHNSIHYAWDKERKLWKQHATATEIKEHYASKEQWNNYFKFAIVRNPFDKIVSSYNWICRRIKPCDLRDRLMFKDFVFRKGVFEKMFNLDETDLRLNNYHQIRPSVEYLFENNNLLIDYVGKFENLDDEWDFICEKLGTKIKIPHRNKHSRDYKHYRDYYDDETKEFILKTYKKDLETFGYEF